jgi:hypothetical protein
MKRYCKDCKYLVIGAACEVVDKEKVRCGHSSNVETHDTWYEKHITYKSIPEILNDDNECKNYEMRKYGYLTESKLVENNK